MCPRDKTLPTKGSNMMNANPLSLKLLDFKTKQNKITKPQKTTREVLITPESAHRSQCSSVPMARLPLKIAAELGSHCPLSTSFLSMKYVRFEWEGQRFMELFCATVPENF